MASSGLVYNDTVIQERGEMLSLTDMWRASGGTDSQRPANWLQLPGTSEFVAHIATVTGEPGESLVYAINERGTWNTWAHKKIALAYFSYLTGAQGTSVLYDQVVDASAVMNALRNFEVPDDIPDMYVYAIREIDTGNIKIGISRDPESRLKQMQTGNSSELELVAYRKAVNRYADERALHADAEEHRLRGEWFNEQALEVLH